MDVQAIFNPVREDLEAVEKVLLEKGTDSRVRLLSRVGEHILSGGGKRFRPALTLLCGHLCGAHAEQRILLAASVELIHNATLLHDDIVDEAAIRRGKPAAHLLWGDTAGVLTANYQFSQAFSMVLRVGGLACLEVVNRTVNAIVEGELLQFLRVGWSEMEEDNYREIILRKTARLIATACQLGALSGERKDLAPPLYRFGLELGMAFQMMDDLLDYTAKEDALGKKIGTDFREGKFTLPLIIALGRCTGPEQKQLRDLLRDEPENREKLFSWARSLIERCDGFAYTHNMASTHMKKALAELTALPTTRERESLEHLARFVVERTY